MTAGTIATLIVEQEGQEEQRIPLRDGQEIRVGRDEGNDIVLHDPGASRMHALFSASSNGVVVTDLNSLNGVFLNGVQLSGMKDLTSRDLVNIGTAKFRIQLASDEMVNSLSSSPASRAMTAQMRPVSVSVVVASLDQFQRFSEELPTEDVAEVQLRWMSGVRDAIEESGGSIDKIIGVNVVAVWVGPDQKTLVHQASSSLSRIIQTGESLSKSWKHEATHPLRSVGVLSSGFGLKGALGANSRQSDGGFTILGDPINAAFTLLALRGQLNVPVLVDSLSAQSVGDVFSLTSLGRKGLPGTEEELEVFGL
ncbi:MAG: FHA domain-containing protein [Bdellovibrionales bacterium]|nr:FHA domain-containing protein [Bdellovibrionales bacterium]